MDLFFTVTGFPVLDTFLYSCRVGFLCWGGSLDTAYSAKFNHFQELWLKMASNQIQPFSAKIQPYSVKFSHFQPNLAIFSQNSAIFSHFRPKAWLFLAGNGWIWLNFGCWILAENGWILAESGWNARERGKERPWSLQNWLPEILRITVPKNQNEKIKITVTDFLAKTEIIIITVTSFETLAINSVMIRARMVIPCVFYVYTRKLRRELILNYLTKITLPKSVSNWLGNVFVPNGILSEIINKKSPIPLPILYYFELIEVTVTDGPVSVLPPLRIAQK